MMKRSDFINPFPVRGIHYIFVEMRLTKKESINKSSDFKLKLDKK